MAIWVVRGGSWRDDAERDFLESGAVGIYFGANRDIDGMNDADLRLEIERDYILHLEARHELVDGPRVRRVVSYFLNQVLKFRDDIRSGDVIVMPRKTFGGYTVAQGVTEGGYEYWGESAYRQAAGTLDGDRSPTGSYRARVVQQ